MNALLAHHAAKRGILWSKLSRAIMVAAKNGGSDPGMNIRLRVAIEDARSVSMPKENIERAVKKGAASILKLSVVDGAISARASGSAQARIEQLFADFEWPEPAQA